MFLIKQIYVIGGEGTILVGGMVGIRMVEEDGW